MANIRLRNLSKSYGPVHVLKDFSLDIADGEFVVLIGPSGCGKSTTLKIIAGLDEATSGTVHIGDRDVTDVAPGDRDIAMVFQNYALYPHLTVRRNMGFGLKVRGMAKSEIDKRVDAVAHTLGIALLLERRPRELSGGQRQRVALGRAIVREPRAFLMDEPLSNLDAKLRVRMRSEITQIHRRLKVTTIYVTHDQTEAMTMADRIVILKDGEIQQVGKPDDMYSRPANLFVASFIGSPAMNFFKSPARLAGDKLEVSLFGAQYLLQRPAQLSGDTVILGVRPEHLIVGSDPLSFPAIPRLVESLGNEKHVHIEIPRESRAELASADLGGEERSNEMLIVRTAGSGSIVEGQEIRLSADPAKIHLFDPKTLAALR